MEKIMIIVNDKYFEKDGRLKDNIYDKVMIDVRIALKRKMDVNSNFLENIVSLTDIKKKILKCKDINSECVLFRDVSALIVIDLPHRYEQFISDLFYNGYEMDMFFEYYGYERMMFKYSLATNECKYVDYD